MDEYLIFHTYILKEKLERAKEDFDEDLVNVERTFSDPEYCLEGDAPNYLDYEYHTELEVTKEGHLAYDDYNDDLKPEFERLKALPPSERWSAALEIAKEWAGAEIAALTGKEAPKSREEAVAALRQFLAEKAHEADKDTIRRISNMLFALDKDNCRNYPFSESIEFYEDWHYLDDTRFTGMNIRHSVESIAFVLFN